MLTIGEICRKARESGECTDYELRRSGKLEYCGKIYPGCKKLNELLEKHCKEEGEKDENI